jgi:hypothetical protein
MLNIECIFHYHNTSKVNKISLKLVLETNNIHYDIICAADLKNTFHTIKVYVNIRPQFFCIALELRSLHCILSFADINLSCPSKLDI